VITQFLGHIVRGEPSSWSTAARRSVPSPTSATASTRLMKIIDNKDGVADSKIYNIGNPKNNYSIRELAT
jgi:nucleoside-diphosphate-sugar epimerase